MPLMNGSASFIAIYRAKPPIGYLCIYVMHIVDKQVTVPDIDFLVLYGLILG